MSIRSAEYRCSPGVLALELPQDMLAHMVGVTVDKAYDRNLVIDKGIFTNRFNLFTVNGKIASGGEILAAAKYHPETLGQVLPVVCLMEEKGEDKAHIILQSEIEKDPDLSKEVATLLATPPNLTVESIIQQARSTP